MTSYVIYIGSSVDLFLNTSASSTHPQTDSDR